VYHGVRASMNSSGSDQRVEIGLSSPLTAVSPATQWLIPV
jgi:hypothetical protein